jgi:hypothetical protein
MAHYSENTNMIKQAIAQPPQSLKICKNRKNDVYCILKNIYVFVGYRFDYRNLTMMVKLACRPNEVLGEFGHHKIFGSLKPN